MGLNNSGSDPVRMEDVVYTLNNIIDDIASMYTDSQDGSEDSCMEEDSSKAALSSNSERTATSMVSLPSSPTLPMSPTSDASSEPEDRFSLYSSSPDTSPTSSGFNTPPISPKTFAFLVGEGDATLDTDTEVDGATVANGFTHSDATSQPSIGLESDAFTTGSSLVSVPLSLAGLSDAQRDHNLVQGLFNVPLGTTPSTNLTFHKASTITESRIIYQTTRHTNSQFITQTPLSTPTINPMPGICPPHLKMTPPALPPRPTTSHGIRDAPPHLPALRSPTHLSAPRLDQNEGWSTRSSMPEPERWSAHLAKQREWARMTITYAAELSEPKVLPPHRPCTVDFKSRSSFNMTSPPRRRTLGATGRKVYLGPRILPRGDWDPERRGGVLDHWRIRNALRRERYRTYDDEEPKQQLGLGLKIATSVPVNATNEEQVSEGSKGTEDSGLVRLALESNPEDRGVEDPNAMRPCVKNGKRIPPCLSISAGPTLQSTLDSTGSTSGSESQVPANDAHTMRLCVKNGFRVLPPSQSQQGGQPHMALEPPHITVLASQTVYAPKPIRATGKYAPKTQSPLSRAFMIPPAVRLRSLISNAESDVQSGSPGSVGQTRRKFASMMF